MRFVIVQRRVSVELTEGGVFTVASPAGGAPPHSLHLTALVQLVKEIPEFLFGEISPESESGGVGLDGERLSPEGESDSGLCSPCAAQSPPAPRWSRPAHKPREHICPQKGMGGW